MEESGKLVVITTNQKISIIEIWCGSKRYKEKHVAGTLEVSKHNFIIALRNKRHLRSSIGLLLERNKTGDKKADLIK